MNTGYEIVGSYMENIPKELMVEIFSNLFIRDLINLESCTNSFRKIIRETKWNHLIVELRNIISIEYVTMHYQFMKYDFSSSLITDEIVKLLGKCHTLCLYGCYQITDETKMKLEKTIKKLYW